MFTCNGDMFTCEQVRVMQDRKDLHPVLAPSSDFVLELPASAKMELGLLLVLGSEMLLISGHS